VVSGPKRWPLQTPSGQLWPNKKSCLESTRRLYAHKTNNRAQITSVSIRFSYCYKIFMSIYLPPSRHITTSQPTSSAISQPRCGPSQSSMMRPFPPWTTSLVMWKLPAAVLISFCSFPMFLSTDPSKISYIIGLLRGRALDWTLAFFVKMLLTLIILLPFRRILREHSINLLTKWMLPKDC